MRTSLTLYSFRFTVLSSLGLLHGCGGSVAPGPTRNTTEGTNTTTGTGTGTTTGTNTGTGSSTGTTTGTGTGSSTGTTTGVVTVTGTSTGTATGSGGATTVIPSMGGSAPEIADVCDGPETDLDNGRSICANGIVHRVEAVTCNSNYTPRPESVQDRFAASMAVAAGGSAGVGGAGVGGTGVGGAGVGGAGVGGTGVGGTGVAEEPSFDLTACTYDADCTELLHGRCDAQYQDELSVLSYCWYDGCVTDADCGDAQVCECDDDVNQCTYSSKCQTDADCSQGNVCLRFEYDTGCGITISYACTTPTDACRFNSDCDADGIGSGCQPGWDPAMPGAQCGGITCQEGRPFLVEGMARVAKPEARADWRLPQSPKLLDLTDTERRHLAGEWQRTALAEHASIAAFARFALELLAVGAPPELLESTQQAMRDETLHAKLAFGLASGYAEHGIGPGPLSCDGALAAHDLESITLNTVLEGCIGETLAALDAQHALEHCTDPVVRAVLQQIAKDEANHAELAWKFVQWALGQDPSLAERVLELVQRELTQAKRNVAQPGTESAWTRQHGVLPQTDRTALRLTALAEVVVPCMRSLCASVPDAETRPTESARLAAAATLVA